MTGRPPLADPLPLATRVRRARRSSKLACGHYVLTGQTIVHRGSRWTCLPCALAAISATANRQEARHP